MGPRIGLIAGSGELPLFVRDEARRRGLFCAVLVLRGEAPEALKSGSDAWLETGAGRVAEALAFFRKHDVRDIVFAGKVDPADLFRVDDLDATAKSLIETLPDRRPAAVVRRAMEFLAAEGFRVLDPGPFLGPLWCGEGLLTPGPLPAWAAADIDFGWPLARAIADQDIGQTLIVKGGLVVAVEGLEGTDEAIRRAGKLAGPGTVVIKVARTSQDSRVDLPAAGPGTVESLIEARAGALCLEAGRVLLLDKDKVLARAGAAGLTVVGKRG